MPSPDPVDYFVFDGDQDASITPHRPTMGNLGGAEFMDEPGREPDPEVFPNAAAENQQEKVIYGVAQTAFSLLFQVDFDSGTPSITGFSTVGTRLEVGDLTVTDNAAGDTTIDWPAGYLPPGSIGPLMTLTEDVEIDRARAMLAADKLSVTVKTKLGATGTDCGFSCCIHGGA